MRSDSGRDAAADESLHPAEAAAADDDEIGRFASCDVDDRSGGIIGDDVPRTVHASSLESRQGGMVPFLLGGVGVEDIAELLRQLLELLDEPGVRLAVERVSLRGQSRPARPDRLRPPPPDRSLEPS